MRLLVQTNWWRQVAYCGASIGNAPCRKLCKSTKSPASAHGRVVRLGYRPGCGMTSKDCYMIEAKILMLYGSKLANITPNKSPHHAGFSYFCYLTTGANRFARHTVVVAVKPFQAALVQIKAGFLARVHLFTVTFTAT